MLKEENKKEEMKEEKKEDKKLLKIKMESNPAKI